MSDSTSNHSRRERQIDSLIAEYEMAAEQGRRLDPEEFLQQHAEYAVELREYLADAQRLQAAIGCPSANASATVETLTLKIRDYRVLNKIGAGGMGTVYLALHLRLEKTVALKILKADRERDSPSIARFEREMKAVGKLEHPHIVRALDAGDEGGTHFLVMEFLEGCDLARLVKSKGRLEVPLACELIRQAALGLQHAHDHCLVHRDVKPSNLMLSTTGQVKVLDLGLAQLQASSSEADVMTGTSEIVGTWRYMAPEQFMLGRQVDSRSDVYSLGVTLYSLLVGELPLRQGQSATHLPPIATLRPDVPPDLQALLGKMLDPQPAERIQTMAEVASALQTYELQGAASIAAIKARLNLPHEAYSHANDPTQSPSSTADGAEVIPPPFQINPPPISAQSTSPAAQVPFRWHRVGLFASGIAAVAFLVLAILGTNAASTKNKQRRLAEERIAELRGAIDTDLKQRDLVSAQAHFTQLVEVSQSFTGLAGANAMQEIEANIAQQLELQQRAADYWKAAQAALADKDVALLIDRLRDYLDEPYATERDQAQSLLADAQRWSQLEPGILALVASWTDTELALYLRTRKLPRTVDFANKTIRNIHDTQVYQIATSENSRRLLEKEKAAAAIVAAAAITTSRKEADDRRATDADRARRTLEAAQQREEADAKADWQRHPERHGILALIPQDAIGGVGVASVNQVLQKIKDAVSDLGGPNQQPPLLAGIAEIVVKEVLSTAPFECYRQDQPLAIIFANPAKAGVLLQIDNVNPLFAMWDRPTLESLGVVVGTPLGDLRDVEKKLKLVAGVLAGEKIRHSKLPHNGEDKQVSILLRDGRLYVGFTDLSVMAVADRLREQASVAMDISPREATRMTSMDLLLHFGPGAWRQEWDAIAEQMQANLATDERDQEAVELASEFASIMRRAKTFLLGVKLDQGVQASLLVLLSRHEDARLVHFQQLIGRGDEPLKLTGLPHDGAAGAFATRGNGLSNAVIAQSLLLLLNQPFVASGVPISTNNRITLSKAFREVWNQVAGTRAGNYGDESLVVVLDTHDPEKFTERLQELVRVWDEISLQLAEGDELKARYRFTLAEEALDGRKVYRLSLTQREPDGATHEQLLIVPVGKQMIVSRGGDQAPLRQAIKNLTEEVPRPGLAEHPAILQAGQHLPANRKMELYLWVSELKRKIVGGPGLQAAAAEEYSSASVTLGETSIGLDVWVPLREIGRLIQ